MQGGPGEAGGAFSISDLDNQFFTYDSTVEVTLSGSDVILWGDPISGYDIEAGDFAPSYTAEDPVFGDEPAINFLSGETLINVNPIHSQSYTMWGILQFISIDQEYPWWSPGGPRTGFRVENGTVFFYNGSGSSGLECTGPAIVAETAYSVICIMNGFSSQLYINGTEYTFSGQGPGTSTSGIRLGRSSQNECRFRGMGIVAGVMGAADRAGIDSIVAGY